MTKQQLINVIDALTELVDAWNDGAADDDRGRADDFLVLTIADDGSGYLGRRPSGMSEIENMYQFDDVDQLAEILVDSECVEFESES